LKFAKTDTLLLAVPVPALLYSISRCKQFSEQRIYTSSQAARRHNSRPNVI